MRCRTHLTDKIVELRGLKNSQQRLYIKGEIFSIDNMVTKVSLVIAHWGIALFFLCSAFPTPSPSESCIECKWRNFFWRMKSPDHLVYYRQQPVAVWRDNTMRQKSFFVSFVHKTVSAVWRCGLHLLGIATTTTTSLAGLKWLIMIEDRMRMFGDRGWCTLDIHLLQVVHSLYSQRAYSRWDDVTLLH